MNKEIIEILEKPFNEDLVILNKKDGLSYLHWTTVKGRLDEAVDGNYSFSAAEQILDNQVSENKEFSDRHTTSKAIREVVVKGRLTIEGVYREAYGYCDQKRGENTGSALMIASQNAFRKCASMFGVGSYLYLRKPTEAKITNKQINFIESLSIKADIETKELCKECFNKTLDTLNVREADQIIKLLVEDK